MKSAIEGVMARAAGAARRAGGAIRRHPWRALLALPLAAAAYVAVLYPFTPSIGDIRKSKQEQPSVVLSADGKELAVFKRANRDWVKLEDISPKVVDALLATEDRRFYEHNGLDFIRTAKAVVNTLTRRRRGRLHADAAARAQPVPRGDRPRADRHPQDQGGDHGAEDRGDLQQGRDPGDLPQLGLLPLQRVGHRDGRAHLLRQAGQEAQRAGGRHAGGHAQGHQLLQPGDQPRARPAAAQHGAGA